MKLFSVISLKLVAIAKDEAPYLPIWIFHHLHIGITSIDIYLNNIEDNSYEIVQKIARYDRRVKIFNADKLLRLSKKSKSDFQQEIYNFALSTERAAQQHSHLLFLDIDEYLMPSNFGDKITKLLSKEREADVISFIWYSDIPSRKRQSFQPLIQHSIKLQKMTPVKSLCRLNGAAVSAKVHRFGYGLNRQEELPISHVLSDGSPAVMSSRKCNRISTKDNVDIASSIEPWFVHHQIYRSHNEYCSGLMRGRSHRDNSKPIKDNRHGYCIHPDQIRTGKFIGEPVKYRIPHWRCIQYNLEFALFIKLSGTSAALEEGKKINFFRYKKLRKLLKNNPGLCQDFRKQLRGTKFFKPTKKNPSK